MKLRFGKARKIKSRKEISRLFKQGRRWECDSFVLIFDKSNFDHGRLAVLVSRKLGNAVKRNKIKRIIREAYRNVVKDNPPFFDILIKPKIKQSDFKWNFDEQVESLKNFLKSFGN